MLKMASVLSSILLVSLPLMAKQSVDKVIDVNQAKRLEVENVRGTISFHPWQHAQVKVVGELDEQTEQFIAELQGDRVVVKVKTPDNLNHGDWFSRQKESEGSSLHIYLPATLNLYAQGVSTDFSVEGLSQGVSISSVSGEVRGEQLAGDVRLKAVSGDMHLSQVNGALDLNNVSGNIKVEQVKGDVVVTNVSGDIVVQADAPSVKVNNVSGDTRLKFATVKRLRLSVVSDDADIELALAEDADIEANSVSGDIKLSFSQAPSARFDLHSSVSGDIRNKLTDDKPQEAKYGPGQKLKFTQGNGNSRVEVTTVSGNIEVK